MAEIGNIALFMALSLAIYSGSASMLGVWRGSAELIASSYKATYATTMILVVATACLVGAFVTKDFQVEYVAAHSSRAMDIQYIWVAFYAGNEGSLLFIALALSLLCALAIFFKIDSAVNIMPHVNFVLMLVMIFFLAVMALLANPFNKLDFIPPDGQGINPLLTHPGMFIHPPILMTGLISFSIPFAFGMGSMISGRTRDEWVDAGRTWGLIAWALLGIGLLLGSWWAYTILGWGGYWAWDPVENAGFMPWIAMTAFIHSIMVQKRRGMFRMWNMALVIIAFGFAQFGMFINRGGPVPSVHSFGQSTLGWIFLMFMGLTLLVSFAVFFIRYKTLKSEQNLESAMSREAAFLMNNLMLLAVAFVTLWGVIFPLISELTTGEIITVGPPFYNQVNGPLFLGLIFLMGVAPYIPWRRSSWNVFRRALFYPFILSLTMMSVLIIVGIREPFSVLSFTLCSFVVAGILQEWVRGVIARHSLGENYLTAFFRLIAGNRPRYGGYVVHLAVVCLALGVAGSSFYDLQRDIALSPGESVVIGEYELKYLSHDVRDRVDRIETTTVVEVYRGGAFLGTYKPQRSFYPSFNMASTRAAIRSTLVEDLYIIPGEVLDNGGALFRVRINPLVMWMWIAGPLLFLGILIALWPTKQGNVTSSNN
jgi:cytochrome c-type biogenesis protein CcmF